METAFHRRFHPVQHLTGSNETLRNFFLLDIGNPRAGSRDKSLIAYTPRQISTAADSQSGVAYTVRLPDEFFYM
jgi:hypothetical protein